MKVHLPIDCVLGIAGNNSSTGLGEVFGSLGIWTLAATVSLHARVPAGPVAPKPQPAHAATSSSNTPLNQQTPVGPILKVYAALKHKPPALVFLQKLRYPGAFSGHHDLRPCHRSWAELLYTL